jgi:hypothetical protein
MLGNCRHFDFAMLIFTAGISDNCTGCQRFDIFHFVRFVANQHVPFVFRNCPDDRRIPRSVIADNLVVRRWVDAVFHAQHDRNFDVRDDRPFPDPFAPLDAYRCRAMTSTRCASRALQ